MKEEFRFWGASRQGRSGKHFCEIAFVGYQVYASGFRFFEEHGSGQDKGGGDCW